MTTYMYFSSIKIVHLVYKNYTDIYILNFSITETILDVHSDFLNCTVSLQNLQFYTIQTVLLQMLQKLTIYACSQEGLHY